MKTLSRFFSRLETMLSAAAFAEEGDHRTAREMMRELDAANPAARKTGRDIRTSRPSTTVRRAK